MPLAALHVVFVLGEGKLLPRSGEVEYFGCIIFGAADKLHAAGGEAEIVDLSAA